MVSVVCTVVVRCGARDSGRRGVGPPKSNPGRGGQELGGSGWRGRGWAGPGCLDHSVGGADDAHGAGRALASLDAPSTPPPVLLPDENQGWVSLWNLHQQLPKQQPIASHLAQLQPSPPQPLLSPKPRPCPTGKPMGQGAPAAPGPAPTEPQPCLEPGAGIEGTLGGGPPVCFIRRLWSVLSLVFITVQTGGEGL